MFTTAIEEGKGRERGRDCEEGVVTLKNILLFV
jgi:hypothetical protein